jgi:hypothetical protein
MSLLTDSQQSYVNSGMMNLHNFFASKNKFFAIKKGTTTIVSESSSHNAFYNSSIQNSVTTETETSGMFLARAYYLDKGTEFREIDGNQGSITANPRIKLVTDVTGRDFLQDSKDVYWDEEFYDVISAPRRHGLLQNNFYTYFLEKVN